MTTLHIVLRDPNPDQRAVLMEVARLLDRLTVASEKTAQLLCEEYQIPDAKIDTILHGAPDFHFMEPKLLHGPA